MNTRFSRRAPACALYTTAAFFGLIAQPAMAVDQPTIINRPAEKYAIAPGGVDMRTGQYVYSETDLQIGPSDGGLELVRTTPVYLAGHANPFGNFSHNWDIMLAERRIRISPPEETGPDYRMNLHIGGRSFVFESGENSPGFGFKSDGPTATLTFANGTKDSSTVIYTVRGPDGTLYEFRPMGSNDCTTSRRCAFVSKITEPDGTVLTFDYAYNPAAAGNRARLQRVTSTRGYVLMLEGSGSRVNKACVINAATALPPAGGTCPAAALATTSYAYDSSGRLTGVTGADGSLSQFSYTPWTNGIGQPGTAMGFVKPGFSTPWLTNKFILENDEEEIPHEITQEQNFADGRTFAYAFDHSPPTENKPIPSIAGGRVTNAQGDQIKYEYAWPILPGSRQRICQFPPCTLPKPDDIYKWTYQQTTGPVLVVDELGRETSYDYCDPPVWEGLPPQEIDRCTIIKDYNYFLPEGGTGPVSGGRPDVASGRVEHDAHGNVIKTTQYPKPGSSLAPIVTEAAYATSNPKTQTKPLWTKDANGNQTDFTYDSAHGGVLTETGPAPTTGAPRPQKRFTYVQRYAWIKNSSGGFSQAASPVWLLASESFCRTSAATGNPSAPCGIAGDEVKTTYDYGPDSGPNNLLLRGTLVTADGVSRRTCFAYDARGNRIAETRPRAGLTSCP